MSEANIYGDVANLRDVELERTVQPEGTKVTTALTNVELEDAETDKAYFVFSFNHEAPEEVAGEGFSQRLYLGLKPKNPKKPKATAFRMSLRTIKSILAGVLASEDEVNDFFQSVPTANGTNSPEVYAAMKQCLESIINAPFETSLGVEFDGDVEKKEDGTIVYKKGVNPDGTPRMVKRGNEMVQAGQYGPKQTIGRVVWKYKQAEAA